MSLAPAPDHAFIHSSEPDSGIPMAMAITNTGTLAPVGIRPDNALLTWITGTYGSGKTTLLRSMFHAAAVLEPASIPAKEQLATAAVLYAQGIELTDILSRPAVHAALRHLAKVHRHPTGEPIVARVTRELLGIGKTDATSGRSDSSGNAKMLVSQTLVDLGLRIKTTIDAAPAILTISG